VKRAIPKSKKHGMTFQEVSKWLAPMRKCLREMRFGEIDSIDGHAVTRMNDQDPYARVEWCLAGFRGLIERCLPRCDPAALLVLESKLTANEPLTIAEVDGALAFLRRIEKPLMRISVDEIQSKVLVEQICIELDAIREAA